MRPNPRFKPYIKSQMERVSRTGQPLNRPLFWDFPDDPRAWDVGVVCRSPRTTLNGRFLRFVCYQLRTFENPTGRRLHVRGGLPDGARHGDGREEQDDLPAERG